MTCSPGSSEAGEPRHAADALLAAAVAGALGVCVAVVFGLLGAGLASIWLPA